MCMAETMAHQLLGRSIQSSYLIISHVNCLFSHYPKSSLPRLVPFSSSPKHCFLSTPQKSASLSSFLCSATSHPPIAIVKNKQPPRYDDEEVEQEHEYEEEYEDYKEKHDGGDDEDIEEFSEVNNAVVSSVEQKQPSSNSTRLPQLTVKEKKELRSYAHSIGKKLKCHQVGKSGVTSSLETSINDALEANELLKLKVHDNCPDEVDVVAAQLQEATHSVVVGHIGRTFILYRPSRRKGATTEKQKPSQRPQRSRIAKSAGWKNRKA